MRLVPDPIARRRIGIRARIAVSGREAAAPSLFKSFGLGPDRFRRDLSVAALEFLSHGPMP